MKETNSCLDVEVTLNNRFRYKKEVFMKKIIAYLATVITLVVLTACSGSNAIIGDWKAQAPDGSNRTIQISKKEIIVDGIADPYKQYGLGFGV